MDSGFFGKQSGKFAFACTGFAVNQNIGTGLPAIAHMLQITQGTVTQEGDV